MEREIRGQPDERQASGDGSRRRQNNDHVHPMPGRRRPSPARGARRMGARPRCSMHTIMIRGMEGHLPPRRNNSPGMNGNCCVASSWCDDR